MAKYIIRELTFLVPVPIKRTDLKEGEVVVELDKTLADRYLNLLGSVSEYEEKVNNVLGE